MKYIKKWKWNLICSSFGIVTGISIGVPIFITNNAKKQENKLTDEEKEEIKIQNDIKEKIIIIKKTKMKKYLKDFVDKNKSLLVSNGEKFNGVEEYFTIFKNKFQKSLNIHSSYMQFISLKKGQENLTNKMREGSFGWADLILIVDKEEFVVKTTWLIFKGWNDI